MATAPQIALRDSTGFTTNLVFTTNEESITITGTVDINTVVIQVAINGGAFVSDPALVSFVLQTFTVPNLSSFPSGLLLNLGVNTIQLRAVDTVGGVSPASTITVTRVAAIPNTAEIPSGISVRRSTGSVDILVALATPPVIPPGTTLTGQLTFLGYNFYASANPGGAKTGYFKVNELPVSTTTVFQENVFGTLDDLAVWDNQFHKNVRVRVTDVDDFGNELAVRLDASHDVSALAGRLRFSSTFENFTLTNYVEFNFARDGSSPNTVNADQFGSVAVSDPLYFVVTGLYFDPISSVEVETPHSQEVLGTPLTLNTALHDLPRRRQQDIVTDYVSAVQRVNTQISLIPGSVSRDVDIDPFASESERIWFVIDFVHRSQSFLTLLQIDNVSGNGVSDPVAGSSYKTALKAALGFTNDPAVQSLIDNQFDKLAGNVQRVRLPGRPSTGQAILYTTTTPTQDITIPANTLVSSSGDQNTGAVPQVFRIAGSFVLPAANAQAFYNFTTKRYEIVVDIIAQQVGAAGNLPAGSITTVLGVSNISITNTNATVFGDDQESNADLASRCILAYSSVDTGTEGGYAATAASQIGIIKATIIKSGDALMMRDYDPVRMKHIGGKVDIWIQGTSERNQTDTFAFTFSIANDIQCQILDVNNLIFEVLDSRVTVNTPIIEILNNPSQNLGVRNVTTGQAYDLTGVQVLTFNTFQLNTTIPQPTTHLDDTVVADYRFRVVNQFFFTLQPVRRVISVVGEVSGPLDPLHNFQLFKTDDPLINGESTIAKNYLQITQFNNIPSGNTIPINHETHVLIGFQNEPLDSVGINTQTIVVFSADRSITYAGPGAAAPDYAVVAGTPTTPAALVRTATSTIPNGATVSVDYVHDENFVVTYVINDLLQQMQQVVNSRRHTTADVLVKQTVENDVDLLTTVQLASGATKDKVDPNIRSAVSQELDTKTIGQGVAQSNVDAAINDTAGVSFNVLPMALMAYGDGSQKLRETVLTPFVHLSSLDVAGNRVFILSDALQYPTTDGAGRATEHKGVFQDDIALAMAPSLSTVGTAPKQGWVIGAGGAVIAGYSDDATLIAKGVPVDQLAATRLSLTANHAVVSLTGAGIPEDDPSHHAYAVSYVIRGDKGSHDIVAAAVEYIILGTFSVTYRNAS